MTTRLYKERGPLRLFREELSAEAELGDQRLVARRFSSAQVAQQSAPLANQLHEPAAGVEVLAVLAQVVCKLLDSFRQQRHLDVSGAGVRRVQPVIGCDLALSFCSKHPLRACALSPSVLSSVSIAYGAFAQQQADILASGTHFL